MAASEPLIRAELTAQMTTFAGRLRRQGFLLGPGEITDALRALQNVNILERREVKDALRAVLIASPEQARLFDAEFELFFRLGHLPPPQLPPLLPQVPGQTPPEAAPPKPKPKQDTEEKPAPAGQASELQGEDDTGDGQGNPQGEGQDSADASPQALLTRLSPNAGESGAVHADGDDLPELLRAASALIGAVELGYSRRKVPRPRGQKLDGRRTLHAASRTAGDPVNLRWLGRPRRTPRFLIVLDGSRSMGQDATRLLRFAYALHLRSRRVEVYAFSTELTRLTPTLRATRPGEPLHLPDPGSAWGGGTRIGENLLRLTRGTAAAGRAHVNRDTAIFILSDGLETGDPEPVARALRDLHSRAGLIVWLSPLAGMPGYQPIQRAIAAALPYLDALLPAASSADLLALAQRLRRGG